MTPITRVRATMENRGFQLLKAAETRSVDDLKILLATGVDLALVDESGRSALFKATTKCPIDVIELLLQSGGRRLLGQKEDNWKDTPIHAASSGRHAGLPWGSSVSFPDAVRARLSCSPDVEDKQSQGKTALFLATEWGQKYAVSILLAHGAKVFATNNTGETCLDAAVRTAQI